MNKYLLLILAMFIFALPAFAQDDEVICEPDLTDSIAQLESLQSAFDETGDVDAFTAGLQEVMTALQQVKTDCTLLPEMQSFQLDNFTISYPVGWVQDVDHDGIYFGTSTRAIEAFSENEPIMPSGQFGLSIFNAVDLFGEIPNTTGDPLQNIADMIFSDVSRNGIYAFDAPISFSINDRGVLQTNFVGSGVEAALIVIDLGNDNYSVFVPAAAIGEFEDFEAILLSMLESVVYTP